MENREVVEILKNVKSDIKNKKYDKAIKFLDNKITKISENENNASSYIDNLITDLK